jgi:Arc/MetJ family transcription regulator
VKSIEIDGGLLSKAREETGSESNEGLVRAALKLLIRREAADRLSQHCGTLPANDSEEVLAAIEAAIEGDASHEAGVEELRQFDQGTHPAQRSQEAYDAWVRTKIQAAEDDLRPPISQEEAETRFADLCAGHTEENATAKVEVREKVTVEVDEALLATVRECLGIETGDELIDTALLVLIYKQADMAMLQEAITESREIDMSKFASDQKDDYD